MRKLYRSGVYLAFFCGVFFTLFIWQLFEVRPFWAVFSIAVAAWFATSTVNIGGRISDLNKEMLDGLDGIYDGD